MFLSYKDNKRKIQTSFEIHTVERQQYSYFKSQLTRRIQKPPVNCAWQIAFASALPIFPLLSLLEVQVLQTERHHN